MPGATGKKGQQELARVSGIDNNPTIGVRMHWLYYSKDSQKMLQDAGFFYDSTSGYNESIGYRAGTTQVFRPKDVDRLLELPMHVMDTAMFYPGHMNLTESEAYELVQKVITLTERFGGVMTVNWHQRSLGPERLWGDFYIKLINELKKKEIWFGTAKDIVGWFDKRRSVAFEYTNVFNNQKTINIKSKGEKGYRGLVLRRYHPGSYQKAKEHLTASKKSYQDIPLSSGLCIPISKDIIVTTQ